MIRTGLGFLALGALLAACSLINAPEEVKAGSTEATGSGGDATTTGSASSGGSGGGTACDAPETECAGACFDLQTAHDHCGDCAVACTSGETCMAGMCECNDNATHCGDACIDTTADPANCGDCDVVCDPAANAQPVCMGSNCGLECDVGFADCNMSAPDGCEVDTTKDPLHCGDCPTMCPAPANTTATCTGSTCGFDCVPGYADCDGDPATGCEVSLANDFANCGACDVACNPNFQENCLGGYCSRGTVFACGGAEPTIQSFFPPGITVGLGSSCSPPPGQVQAMFVSRNGNGQVTAATLNAYLNAGGIVITEWNNSADLFSKAFAGVPLGNYYGNSCADNIALGVQYSANDAFWQKNTFMALQPQELGCGYNMAAYPGITPLAGWDGAGVSLAYRDKGPGRLWLVESDWSDGEPSLLQISRDLMAYMMLHRK